MSQLFHRRGLFSKNGKTKSRANEEASINVTSLADIFTILLVFLLKSYSTSAVNVSPGVQLPAISEGGGEEVLLEALKVEIGPNGVLVEGEFVGSLKDLAGNQREKFSQAIEQARMRNESIAKVNRDLASDSNVLIMADQTVSYGQLKPILLLLAEFGYADYKLALAKNE